MFSTPERRAPLLELPAGKLGICKNHSVSTPERRAPLLEPFLSSLPLVATNESRRAPGIALRPRISVQARPFSSHDHSTNHPPIIEHRCLSWRQPHQCTMRCAGRPRLEPIAQLEIEPFALSARFTRRRASGVPRSVRLAGKCGRAATRTGYLLSLYTARLDRTPRSVPRLPPATMQTAYLSGTCARAGRPAPAAAGSFFPDLIDRIARMCTERRSVLPAGSPRTPGAAPSLPTPGATTARSRIRWKPSATSPVVPPGSAMARRQSAAQCRLLIQLLTPTRLDQPRTLTF